MHGGLCVACVLCDCVLKPTTDFQTEGQRVNLKRTKNVRAQTTFFSSLKDSFRIASTISFHFSVRSFAMLRKIHLSSSGSEVSSTTLVNFVLSLMNLRLMKPEVERQAYLC